MNQRELCKQKFKNHKASLIMHDENFLVVDWKNENQSIIDSIRYIVDIKNGNLIVSGDCGYSIASWYDEVFPSSMKTNLNDPGYYSEKLRCTSDKYTYEQRDIEEDLEAMLQHMHQTGLPTSEIEKDYALLKKFYTSDAYPAQSAYITGSTPLPDNIMALTKKYAIDSRIGQRLSPRIYMWAIGYQMAYNQLDKMYLDIM